MKTTIIDCRLWRELSITYGPRTSMIKIMREQYGMVREQLNASGAPRYKIIDESKYLMFLLRWS